MVAAAPSPSPVQDPPYYDNEKLGRIEEAQSRAADDGPHVD
jgi:hypothetical protein